MQGPTGFPLWRFTLSALAAVTNVSVLNTLTYTPVAATINAGQRDHG